MIFNANGIKVFSRNKLVNILLKQLKIMNNNQSSIVVVAVEFYLLFFVFNFKEIERKN